LGDRPRVGAARGHAGRSVHAIDEDHEWRLLELPIGAWKIGKGDAKEGAGIHVGHRWREVVLDDELRRARGESLLVGLEERGRARLHCRLLVDPHVRSGALCHPIETQDMPFTVGHRDNAAHAGLLKEGNALRNNGGYFGRS